MIIFIENLPQMLPVNCALFGQVLSEDKISRNRPTYKQELPMAVMLGNGSRHNEQSLQRTFHRCFLPIFSSFGLAVSEEKILKKSTNQKQELSRVAMFVNGSGQNEHFFQRTFHRCFLPNFGIFVQAVSGKYFFQKLTTQKYELPMVVMFVYGSEFCQVQYNLVQRFQRRRFKRDLLSKYA